MSVDNGSAVACDMGDERVIGLLEGSSLKEERYYCVSHEVYWRFRWRVSATRHILYTAYTLHVCTYVVIYAIWAMKNEESLYRMILT